MFFLAVIECTEVGCPRRCGGQGDLLSGLTALLYFWAKQAQDRWRCVRACVRACVRVFNPSHCGEIGRKWNDTSW